MKKLILFTTLIAMCMTACSSKKTEAQPVAKQSKTLVAYFSATGTTKAAAEILAKLVDGELFEIEPETPYTDADLDWRDKKSRTTIEMNDSISRPALKSTKADIADYDTIYIGYPIWWYVAPHIINSFVEAHDLKGKTLIPFATSGGSPVGHTVDDLRAHYPDLNWKDGGLLNNASEQSVKFWLDTQK